MAFATYTQSAIDAISPYLRTVGNRDNRVEAMKQRIFGISADTGTAIGNIFAREQRKREVNIGAEDVEDIQARIDALKSELADIDQQIALLSSPMTRKHVESENEEVEVI